MASRITRVSRFSTGTVDIHPQHAYRGRSPMYWWILTSRRWLEGRPINVYVIEHPDGVVVFDTGQDRASVTDPSYFPDGANGVIYRRLARFHVSQDETLTAGPRTPRLPHQRRHPRRRQPSPPGPHRRYRRDTGSGPARLGRRVAIAASADAGDPRSPPRAHRPARREVEADHLRTRRRPGAPTLHRRSRPVRRRLTHDPPHARTHAGFHVDVRAPERWTSAAARRRPHLRRTRARTWRLRGRRQ